MCDPENVSSFQDIENVSFLTQSQRQLFKVVELAFSQLADIPSFIPHLEFKPFSGLSRLN
jgi:hypothetical protein